MAVARAKEIDRCRQTRDHRAARRRACDIDFIVLKDGTVYFEGHADGLRHTNDAYLETFLSDWFPPLIA